MDLEKFFQKNWLGQALSEDKFLLGLLMWVDKSNWRSRANHYSKKF